MNKVRRVVTLAVVLVSGAVFACSQSPLLPGEQPLTSTSSIQVRDSSGADVEAPHQVLIDDVAVKIGAGVCGIDVMTIRVTAHDTTTPAASLRFVASFGETAELAAAAEPELIFDASSPTEISVPLVGESRFDRGPICFTLAAVDAAANVGARSKAECVDTSKASGCSAAPVMLLPLGLLLLRRRRR